VNAPRAAVSVSASPAPDPADELLALRCQLGEAGAFDDLVGRWHQPLWRYVRRLTGDEDAAAETVQDVWLRVLRAIARLRDPARLRAWLFGIARRAVMDRLREQYAVAQAGAELDASGLDVVAEEEDADLEAELAQMRRELLRLPVLEREALTLFYLDELSLAEIAAVLAVPVGTVKSRLFRARRALREQMQEGAPRPAATSQPSRPHSSSEPSLRPARRGEEMP
jgi:RNA polymerase sigma-70 factor (ECF subfamily)